MASNERDHREALATLERLDRRSRELEAAQVARAKRAEVKPAAAPIRLLDHHPAAEQRARREGEALLDAMHRAGIGDEWHDAGSLTGGDR